MVKKRSKSLFLAKLLAATPLAFVTQATAAVPPLKSVELAPRGERGLQITVDAGSFDVVILPQPKASSAAVEVKSLVTESGMRVSFSEMAADFFSDLHQNHRDEVVFWGAATLSVLALLI